MNNQKNNSLNNSGLPRRSCLTARNDVVPFCEPCVPFANFAVEKINRKEHKEFSQRTQRKNLVNLKKS